MSESDRERSIGGYGLARRVRGRFGEYIACDLCNRIAIQWVIDPDAPQNERILRRCTDHKIPVKEID